MNQYYIIEIQQYDGGDYGHIVHYAHDDDPAKAKLKGESKFYEVLSSAAVSELPMHSAILIGADCVALMAKTYRHNKEDNNNE